MKITREEAKRIADLAHLAFDDAALDRMAAEMTKILSYIDQLAEVDVGVAADSSAPDATPLRDDVVGSQPADPARNAPEWDSGHFVVPRVIGE
jgi:aspartyl-tRNA(Asn)/glutamyl-tRNA(Gln) amidotransferase subunit C